jgi:hypothetical protein
MEIKLRVALVVFLMAAVTIFLTRNAIPRPASAVTREHGSSLVETEILTNRQLINYHVAGLQYFNKRSPYSFKVAVERFLRIAPKRLFSFVDLILVISYKQGKLTLEGNNSMAHDDFGWLAFGVVKAALESRKVPIPDFKIIVDPYDIGPIAPWLGILAAEECKQDEVCRQNLHDLYLRTFHETPIFRLSKNEQGLRDGNSEAGKNIFLLPDLYMFFANGSPVMPHRPSSPGPALCPLVNPKDDMPLKRKINKAYFLGSATNGRILNKDNFTDFSPGNMRLNNHIRLKMKAISIKYPDKVIVNIVNFCEGKLTETDPFCKVLAQQGYRVSPREGPSASLRYKFIMSIDGNSAAWCRPVWIMNSNSVLLKVKGTATEWFYPAMKPNFHFIPISDDEQEFMATLNQTLALDDRSVSRISKNAQRFVATFLTDKAIKDYAFEMLYAYAKLYERPDGAGGG